MAELEIRAISWGDIDAALITGGAASAPWTGSGDDDDEDNIADGGNRMNSCEAINGADDAATVAAVAAAAAAFGLTEPGVTMAGNCDGGSAGEAPTVLLVSMLLKTLLSSSSPIRDIAVSISGVSGKEPLSTELGPALSRPFVGVDVAMLLRVAPKSAASASASAAAAAASFTSSWMAAATSSSSFSAAVNLSTVAAAVAASRLSSSSTWPAQLSSP